MNTTDSIHTRHTNKILSTTPLPPTPYDETLVRELLEAAYWAPFHKPCAEHHQNGENGLTAIMPWRFYIVDSHSCRQLSADLTAANTAPGKIEKLLNAADYLIQVTWTADKAEKPLAGNALFEGSINNMEHIAAAGVAIQNMLLTATAKGIANYWSSGGVLRDSATFAKLGINQEEILLGSIFLFTAASYPDCEQQTSKLRYRRSPIETFSRRVSL